jgi:hypothetical protein
MSVTGRSYPKSKLFITVMNHFRIQPLVPSVVYQADLPIYLILFKEKQLRDGSVYEIIM